MFRLIVVLVVLAVASSQVLLANREKYEALFFEHVQKFQLSFSSGRDFVSRLEIFAARVDEIETHNAQPGASYKMGLNQFSHLTAAEFQDAVHLGSLRPPYLRKNAPMIHEAPLDMSSVPASVDWVSAGAVTPVKNQGNCGSCWSFSTTGSLEGIYYIKNKNLQSFSEQDMVSCDNTDSGCNGGWMDTAFTWVQGKGGLPLETTYPYTSGTTGASGTCDKSKTTIFPGSAPTGFVDVQANSVNALMSAVAQQPVSIAIQADQASFQTYSSGVLTAKCGQQLDHGVLVTGYGTLNGVDYWQVKNSWGSSWGYVKHTYARTYTHDMTRPTLSCDETKLTKLIILTRTLHSNILHIQHVRLHLD